MRKVILGVAISLDGYIEGPNGQYDWCFTDQDYGIGEFTKQIDALLMGRKTFDLVKGMGGDNPWKGVTTYVVTRGAGEANTDEVRWLQGDVVERVRSLKSQPGKNIWLFGGAELTASMINEDLIDEFWLSVHPILLGEGKTLWKGIVGRKKLQLLDCKSYNTGLVSLRYGL